ncbi:MAG TPA: hypothetical protein PLR87_15400 [Thermoanaerobaculaceae bacterium]|nr:hypothetical protein [Dermatophilaceae bacterium]HPC84734.1 hypothetical protein [Thermoanaerobaculaceae bacterium]
MSQSQEVVRALRSVLDDRRDKEADVRPAKVVGRNTDGTAKTQRLDAECVGRGGASGYGGEIVVSLPAIMNRRGTSGVAGATQRGSGDTLWVEALDPAVFSPGDTALAVTVTGRGFTPTTRFEFLSPDGSVNEDVTIVTSVYVDDETYTLTINVAADAALFEAAALAYDR